MTMQAELVGDRLVPSWTFGDRVRKARGVAKMSQAEFAEAIEVAEGSVAAWETDRAKPRDIVKVCKRIEVLTRIPASWLLDLDGPRTNQPNGESWNYRLAACA